jgi:hypothetical protein
MCAKAFHPGSQTEASLSALREHPLRQRRFGERQSGCTVVINPRVLGVDRVSACFPAVPQYGHAMSTQEPPRRSPMEVPQRCLNRPRAVIG